MNYNTLGFSFMTFIRMLLAIIFIAYGLTCLNHNNKCSISTSSVFKGFGTGILESTLLTLVFYDIFYSRRSLSLKYLCFKILLFYTLIFTMTFILYKLSLSCDEAQCTIFYNNNLNAVFLCSWMEIMLIVSFIRSK